MIDNLATHIHTLQPDPQESVQIKTPPSLAPGAGHVVAITSGKGGVGKSNISVNLGMILSQLGQRVCLFDADINLANINILLGLNPSHTLHDFLNEQLDIDEILIPGPGGLQIIPAANGIADYINLDERKQTHLLSTLRSLEKSYDYLIIDTAAGVDEAVINFLLAAPHIIITITTEPTSLTDAFRLLKELKRHGFSRTAYVVVNMVSGRMAADDAYKRFSGAVRKYLQSKLCCLGYIQNDYCVPESVRKQQALVQRYPDAKASRSLMDIARRLMQSLDNQSDSDKAEFSSYFEDLSSPETPYPGAEDTAIVRAEDDTEYVCDMKKALDYLKGITVREAIKLMTDAILTCDIKYADQTMDLHMSLLNYAMRSRKKRDD